MDKQLSAHQFLNIYKWLGINLNDLGCVMLDLKPFENAFSIAVDGAEVALYYAKDKTRFWINGWVFDKPHTTLLYGLLSQGKNLEPHIERALEGWKLNEVEIEDIGFFNSPYPDEPYWCLVAHITMTPKLLEGHQRLEFLPHINTFTGYKPHATICYLDKGQGDAYRDGMIADFKKLWVGKTLEVLSVNLGGNNLA